LNYWGFGTNNSGFNFGKRNFPELVKGLKELGLGTHYCLGVAVIEGKILGLGNGWIGPFNHSKIVTSFQKRLNFIFLWVLQE